MNVNAKNRLLLAQRFRFLSQPLGDEVRSVLSREFDRCVLVGVSTKKFGAVLSTRLTTHGPRGTSCSSGEFKSAGSFDKQSGK